jgi:TonB family protein
MGAQHLLVLAFVLAASFQASAAPAPPPEPDPASSTSTAGEVPKWRFPDGVSVSPGDKVEPPVLLLRVRPVYTRPVQTAKPHERIALELAVNERGSVVHATVVRPLEPSLDADAVAAAMKWKYTPARLNGAARPFLARAVLFYSYRSPGGAPEEEAPAEGLTWVDERWGFQGRVEIGPDDEARRPEILQQEAKPGYSESARKRKISGVVVLEVRIDAEGRVTEARVLQPLEPGLDDNAVAAVLQWRFRPARLNGAPRASVYKLTTNFQVQ